MCIIAAKPVGIAMPSDQTIENMWNGNNDGAGFMWAEKGSVHIRKGFMTFEKFRTALDEFLATHDATNTALVMHFRITTHGGTKPENCHPFPITDNVGLLTKLECKTKVGVAHNGIINISPRKGISDTMEYIASQLAPLYRGVPDFYRNKNLIEMIYNATASRLAFLDGEGNLFTVGEFQEDNGIKYSNGSYKNFARRFPFSYGFGGWADDYGEYEDPFDGSYINRTLMCLDNNFGYLIGTDGSYQENTDDMYAVDKNDIVYEYSYTLDAFRMAPGLTAYNWTGAPVRFDPESRDTNQEIVFIPDQYARKKDRNVKFTNLSTRDSGGGPTAPVEKEPAKNAKGAGKKKK
jgi:hypothetical protein